MYWKKLTWRNKQFNKLSVDKVCRENYHTRIVNKKICKAVVFDMDGVLFDSERITRIQWKRAAGEYQVSDIETAVKECTGRSVQDTWAYLQKKYGSDFPAQEFRQRCSTLFHEYVDEHGLPLMPFAKEILEYLHERNYRIALASSTRTPTVTHELKDAGLYDYFETITCGDMVEHSKPAPDIYLMSCRSLNLEPGECIAVEDSPNGIRSAYEAGMMPVMVPDQIQPDDEICAMLYKKCDSLKEITEIL